MSFEKAKIFSGFRTLEKANLDVTSNFGGIQALYPAICKF